MIGSLCWRRARRSRKSPQRAKALARTTSGPPLPGTSALAASKSATASSTPNSRRGQSNLRRSDPGITRSIGHDRRLSPSGPGFSLGRVVNPKRYVLALERRRLSPPPPTREYGSYRRIILPKIMVSEAANAWSESSCPFSFPIHAAPRGGRVLVILCPRIIRSRLDGLNSPSTAPRPG